VRRGGGQAKEQPHMTQKIPEGFHTVTPYLAMNNAAQAIDF
jgi:hypothetical protein